MKKLSQIGLIALMLAAAVLVFSSPAYAIKIALSGQINRAAMYADDGAAGEWFFVDNSNSTTRFRFRGANKFKGGWSVGLLWEVEMESNPSSDVSMDDDSDIPASVHFNERHMDIWVEKKNFTMRLGQGDTASNGTSEVDLSGTAVATYSNIADVGGGFEFTGNGQELGVTVGDSRSNFDGLSRRDRLRVDSPRWEGFYASLSFEGNSEWDLAARYAGKLGKARLAAASCFLSLASSTSLAVKIKIDVGDGEPIESALRRFKREVNKSGHLMELRHRRHFENSQEKKKRKVKEGRMRRKFERIARRRMANQT